MKSLRKLYRIGYGPSSSHTMGPSAACGIFLSEHPDADSYRVVLYGSLSKTGRGHRTDIAVTKAFAPKKCEVVFGDADENELPHANTMDIYAVKDGADTARMRVMSVGGGEIEIEGRPTPPEEEIYPENSFREIAEFCNERGMRLSDYVALREGDGIWDYLATVWDTMQREISDGLAATGTLPGGLGVERKAHFLMNARHMDESKSTYENRVVCAYAFAAGEQNAAGGIIATAPTCGACGVVPAALKYAQQSRGYTDEAVLRALAVGGVIGNLAKSNASISGAECGCQAEIGVACSMASAALAELYGMGIDQIEYAAEVALEHHLGLTCDPIRGLVQIPCIERNAVAAMRAINAVTLANFLTFTRKISFDLILETMYRTGRDLNVGYRETSTGGLAKLYGKG